MARAARYSYESLRFSKDSPRMPEFQMALTNSIMALPIKLALRASPGKCPKIILFTAMILPMFSCYIIWALNGIGLMNLKQTIQ